MPYCRNDVQTNMPLVGLPGLMCQRWFGILQPPIQQGDHRHLGPSRVSPSSTWVCISLIHSRHSPRVPAYLVRRRPWMLICAHQRPSLRLKIEPSLLPLRLAMARPPLLLLFFLRSTQTRLSTRQPPTGRHCVGTSYLPGSLGVLL